MTKQSKRRKLAKLHSCIIDGKPWSIMPSAMASIMDSIDSMKDLESALSFGRDVESTTKIVNGVAVMPVSGVLRDDVDYMVRFGYASSYQLMEREIKQAVNNPQIKSVMLYIDSPGGSAIGCKRVADIIFELRGEKPIHAYTQGVCGSAAYYLAAACNRIEATADSLVGSVGTIFPHMEMAGMLKDWGIGATVITNADSPKKGHGNQYEPLSDDAKNTLQEFVNSYGRGFIEDVARYRGVSADQVVANFGQGDAFRADAAIGRGMIDAVVSGLSESLESISGVSSETDPVEETDDDETPVVTGHSQQREIDMKVSKKIRAQLFAMDLIDDMECSDEICTAIMSGWFKGEVPSDESETLKALRAPVAVATEPAPNSESTGTGANEAPAQNVQNAHETEMGEARLADLRAAADLVNSSAGHTAVTAEMVLDAFEAGHDVKAAMENWNEVIAESEPAIPSSRIRINGEGADRYAQDVIDAMVYRASDNSSMELSDNAAALANRPLWAVAGECLQLSGQQVDMYGSREFLAEQAMQMGNAHQRHTFFSADEDRRYLQASNVPVSRPGDFPNILSGLANKFLDTIELDEDYSYPDVSALLPGGLNDFKPGLMANKGIVEELDELADAEEFKQLGLAEEVLSYIFLRRFGNKFGWTPIMIANDDMNAFAEGMIGLVEAWQVTQNRLVVDRFTTTETLLDGNALFANRADTGTGTNPATNDNRRTGGADPSDAEWAAMETQYADIGGIDTGRRVRGTLNVAFCPPGTSAQEARRTFLPLNQLEPKSAATTANVGLYRGAVRVVTESELRVNSATTWFGLRNPTRLNTATVVRAYFNGFGQAGRRERWYDPENKTTWVSLEGRIAVAAKNWRYAVRNTA